MGGLNIMAQHEVEITILKNGQVKVHVKGAKGKSCMAYSKWLASIIGKVENQQLTSEYYEPDVKARIDLEQDLKAED
jgi:hypothetical protein